MTKPAQSVHHIDLSEPPRSKVKLAHDPQKKRDKPGHLLLMSERPKQNTFK